MKFLSRLVCSVVTLTFVCLAYVIPVRAQTATYTVDYLFKFTPGDHQNLDTELEIHLKNLRTDLYINEFFLIFPKNFITGDITAEDMNGPVEFNKQELATGLRITFTFDEPTAQRAEHFITLKYKLNDLFSQQGFVTEAILPLIQPDENSKVNVELHLSPTFDKTISMSKPIPSSIEGTKLLWNDVKTRTIYAVFGKSQIYKAHLSYNLENKTIFKNTRQVAFPPDTLYQRVIMNKVSPEPDKTFIDEDGNLIAEYTLNAKERKKIKFDAFIEVFPRPQESMRTYVKATFEDQKKFLLTEHALWNMGPLINDQKIKNLKGPKDIYRFVVNELSYSFDKARQEKKRLGAQAVLKRPSLAVCTEFTDLFIALAREKGIYAREIEGYGYSTRQNIRPLSLVTDVLHAWPEFYEPAQDIWIPVDPTWEDTSGIDYFSGLDINHIVFAIHGKSTEQPLPAGFYKTDASKDIDITVSAERPKEKANVTITANIPVKITTRKFSSITLHVKNTGNISLPQLSLNPKATYLVFENPIVNVDFIAPYQTKDVTFKVKARVDSPDTDMLALDYEGAPVYSTKVMIDPSGQSSSGLFLILGGAIGLIGIIGYLFIHRH